MKRVSFKVALALKEAGYPQYRKDVGYVTESCTDRFNVYHEGELTENASRMVKKVSAPTYLEVWLWLWREKRIEISCSYFAPLLEWRITINDKRVNIKHNDPEEAIIMAIEYIVENNLIK